MKTHFAASELAGLADMPTTERGVQLRAEREGWPKAKRAGRGGGREYPIACLPAATQAALLLKYGGASASAKAPAFAKPASAGEARSADKQDEGSSKEVRRAHLWAAYDRKPDSHKEKAQYRLRLLHSVEQLVAGGTGRLRAIAIVADQAGEAPATLRRWAGLVKGLERGDWLPALAPKWTGGTSTAECDPRAWDFFKADYLRPERPGAEACYRRLERAAAKHGWVIPSCASFRRRLERELPRMATVMAREGMDAAKRMYPAQERDRSVFRALEAVNADGHKLDLFARFEDGSIGRPIAVVWQDLYSGKILAWRIGEVESAEMIRLAMVDLVDRFGIPTRAYFDNGRGFASKMNTGGTPSRWRFKVKPEEPQGVFVQLGIDVHWTLPYSGQSKPIERAFRDLAETVSRHPAFAGAYTGNTPDAKPDNYGSKAIPIDEMRRIFAEEVAAHNARAGRRTAICNGRSFDEVFVESYMRSPIMKATAEQRRLLLLAAEDVTADRENASIRLHGNRYWSDSPALARMAGRKIIVRFDPQNLREPVHVYTPEGAFVATCDLIEKTGFDDVEQAGAHARARKTRIKAIRTQLEAERRMSAIEAAALLPAPDLPPAPETKVIRPVFSRAATAAKAEPAMGQEEFEASFSATIAQARRARGLPELG